MGRRVKRLAETTCITGPRDRRLQSSRMLGQTELYLESGLAGMNGNNKIEKKKTPKKFISILPPEKLNDAKGTLVPHGLSRVIDHIGPAGRYLITRGP